MAPWEIDERPNRTSPARLLEKSTLKGMEAHLPMDTLLQESTGVVINTTADMEERFQCVKETQERAIAFIQEARTKYEKASDNDLRNRYKQLRSFRTGDLVLRKTKDESIERKCKPTYEIALCSGGHGRAWKLCYPGTA